MHQRLLTVDVLAGSERGNHHRCVVQIRRIHDHRIKLVQVLVECFPVILHLHGLGQFPGHTIQVF